MLLLQISSNKNLPKDKTANELIELAVQTSVCGILI